jgi:hypothetical protein
VAGLAFTISLLLDQFGGCLPDPISTPFDGVIGFAVFLESRRIHARRYRKNGLSVLDDVHEPAGGLSEGKGAVPVDVLLKTLFADRFLDHIHLAAEQSR